MQINLQKIKTINERVASVAVWKREHTQDMKSRNRKESKKVYFTGSGLSHFRMQCLQYQILFACQLQPSLHLPKSERLLCMSWHCGALLFFALFCLFVCLFCILFKQFGVIADNGNNDFNQIVLSQFDSERRTQSAMCCSHCHYYSHYWVSSELTCLSRIKTFVLFDFSSFTLLQFNSIQCFIHYFKCCVGILFLENFSSKYGNGICLAKHEQESHFLNEMQKNVCF